MPKLITPVQYEPTLDELNEVRPLQLADEVKSVISSPALNLNPVSHGRPVFGKLSRCNNQGALLTNGNSGYENYEAFSLPVYWHPTQHYSITFSQKVKRVFLLPTMFWFDPALKWTDPSYLITIKELNPNGDNWL